MGNSRLISVLDTSKATGKKAPRKIVDDDPRTDEERLADLKWAVFNEGKFLSLKDEVFCGRLIRKGKQEDATRKDKRLARRANEVLSQANERLVLKMANAMYSSMPRGTTREDCIAAGHLGLARAINDYDPERGFKVSTLATWWVRHYLQSLSHSISRPGHVPTGKLITVAKIHKELEDIKTQTGQSKATDAQLREILEREHLSMADYEKVTLFNLGSISMDTTMNDGDDTRTVGDLLRPDSVENSTMGDWSINEVESEHERMKLFKIINTTIDGLPDVQKRLVRQLYFEPKMGKNGELRKTEAQARREVGVSKHTADVQLAKAMKTIKDALTAEGYEAADVIG